MRAVTIFILIVLALSGFFLMLNISSASSSRVISVVNTIYLEHGNVVNPKVLNANGYGNFIIAGSLNQKAWAIKTDNKGNIKWNFVAPAHEDLLKNETRKYTASELEYSYVSSAIMPDDSIFLCGYIPYIQMGSSFLTHLDGQGNVLNDQSLIHPQDNKEISGEFISAKAWNNGFVVVGRALAVDKSVISKIPGDQNKFFYWIIFFDATGKKQWEKLEPISKKLWGFPNNISQLQIVEDGGFVFVAERNGSGASEIVYVAQNGDVTKNMLDGEFTIVSPIEEEKDIHLVSVSTSNLVKLTLDNNLKEISRIVENHTDGYVNTAYIMPDKSLVLFGSKVVHHHHEAVVVKVDKSMKDREILNLSPGGESISVSAAIYAGNKGDFVSIRGAIKRIEQSETLTQEKMEQSRLGVALDFIKIK